MRALSLIAAAVLMLIPAVAMYWQGGLGQAAATAVSTPPSIAGRSQPAPPADPAHAAPAPAGPTPAAPAAPSPGPKPAAWERAPLLEAAVTDAMTGFAGRYSVIVQDLTSGRRWELNPTDRYHPASTIKMPVTLYALNQHLAGKLGWQDGITYTKADFESPGGGAFETAPFGGLYPVENLVNRALMYSNNVAVNMLGRHLGWENIRQWSRTIDGELYQGQGGAPEVTARSELGWWLHLERLSREEPAKAELLLNPLRQVAYDGRIAAGLPKGVPYLHKFGSYNGFFHDGGIIFTNEPYALIVMTAGGGEHEADDAIARVSAAVYQVMAAER